jgi:surface protein
MFRVCNSLVGNSSFNLWDMSSAVNLSNMFVLTSFNQPIGNWNTGNVTNMASMFAFDQVFNQPIGN